MYTIRKTITTVALGAVLAAGGVASAAVAAEAGGAGGGTFTCTQSGVPGWGTVTSQYNHPTLTHYATAVGRGRQTVTKGPGTNAVAKISRNFTDNACYWGTE